nr:Major Facilitator Superfamily [uncultured bacterium]
MVGLLINLTFESAMLGFFLPFTLILQIGLGFSVIKAALVGIPTAIGISVTMAVFSQKLIPKLGRYTMVLGTFLMAGGLILLYELLNRQVLNISPWTFIPGLLLVGAGMALIMAPMFSVALADVDAQHAGSASGILSAVQQLGGAIGTALLGLVFFSHLTTHATPSFNVVAPQIHQQLSELNLPVSAQEHIVQTAKVCFVDRSKANDASGTPESCKQTENTKSLAPASTQRIGSIVQNGVKQANSNNFISAFKASIIFELCILAAIIVLSFLLPRHIKISAEPEAL